MSCSRLVASPRCLSELYPLNEFYMGKACALNISLRYISIYQVKPVCHVQDWLLPLAVLVSCIP